MNLDLFQETDGTRQFHYAAYPPGVPNARANAPTLCGLKPTGMRKAAWFTPGDPRGKVHYERGCTMCIAKLSDLLDEAEVIDET